MLLSSKRTRIYIFMLKIQEVESVKNNKQSCSIYLKKLLGTINIILMALDLVYLFVDKLLNTIMERSGLNQSKVQGPSFLSMLKLRVTNSNNLK